MLKIGNRRYLGSKRSLLTSIYSTVEKHKPKDNYVFADLFAGTGSVASFFADNGKKIIVNDNLFSNFVTYKTWFSDGKYSNTKIKKILKEFNEINPKNLNTNYFSNIYGNKYFSIKTAKKIGYIRDKIENINLTERERYILLTSLMYATDKVANTVGHYEHFLSNKDFNENFKMEMLDLEKKIKSTIYSEDANELAKKIKSDVVYIDPPYNARQYINFYHVLENLMRWDKPTEFEGISMKFKRNHLKSDYSKVKAPIVFEDLIKSLDTKLIVVSYNNTYSAKSSASNNKISEKMMEKILSNKGDLVEKKVLNHKFFNSGKTDFKEHKEFIYVCKVK